MGVEHAVAALLHAGAPPPLAFGLIMVLSVFVGELGLPVPVPNELLLLWAGARLAGGGMRFWTAVGGVVVADQAGSLLCYALCRLGGRPLLERYGRWILLPPARLHTAEARLARVGPLAFFVGRVVPLLRVPSSGAAGCLRLPWRVVLPAGLLASLVWGAGCLLLGRVLGQAWETPLRGWGLACSLRALTCLPRVVGGVVPCRTAGERHADHARE
jgi:membrane protein DedA with SNARE-associated domain